MPTFGPPDDRQPDDVLVLLGVVALGQQLDQAVEQVAGAEALGGGHGQRLAEPEPVEVVREHEVVRGVDLVGRHHHGQRAAAQDLGDLLVARPHAGAGVDHEQRDLGVGDRLARLVLDADRERVVVLEVDAAGVDQRQPAAVPLGRELLAVARDPRPLVDDRLARLREAVDERRLADVGIADDGDFHDSSRASTTSVTTCATTSSSVRPVVSTGTASGAGAWTERSSLASRSSRSACSRRDLLGVGAELGGAAGRALARVGGQEHLDRGVGRHHGGDVAPLGDPVAVGDQRLLLGHQRGAHAGVGGHARGRLGHLGRADRLGHVAAVDQHAIADLDLDPLRHLRGRLAALGRGQADGAVHRAGVEVREAELARDGAGHGGLAGARRAVDRDHHGPVSLRARRHTAGVAMPARSSGSGTGGSVSVRIGTTPAHASSA